MEYGKVFGRAWEITWRWKILWILGFLVSLGSISGGGSNVTYQFGQGDVERWSYQIRQPEAIAAIVGIVLAVACVAVLVAIALAIVSVIARGALIAGVQDVEEVGSTSFGRAWSAGRRRFWTLLGISILAALPVNLLGLVGAAVLTLIIVGAVQGGGEFGRAAGAGIALAVACGGALCCIVVIASTILGVIQVYADRAAVLEGLGWIDAFKRGWQVLKENIGPTLILWLVFLVIGLVFAAVIAGAVMALALPFFAVFGQTESSAWWIVPLSCGSLIAVIVGALIQSVYQVFYSATWTLAYRQLTGSAAPSVAPTPGTGADQPLAPQPDAGEPDALEPPPPSEPMPAP
jgi:hypothetical protein